jgi:HK97 gp10 family phage protein
MESDFLRLIAKFDAIKGDELKKAQRKALKAVGKIVQDAIVARAPVRVDDTPSGNALAPGALKADIQVHVHIASDAKAATDISSVTIEPGKATAHVALWVERGHANPKAKKGLTTTPAYPFIRPAQDSVEQAAVTEYETIVTAEIERVMNA